MVTYSGHLKNRHQKSPKNSRSGQCYTHLNIRHSARAVILRPRRDCKTKTPSKNRAELRVRSGTAPASTYSTEPAREPNVILTVIAVRSAALCAVPSFDPAGAVESFTLRGTVFSRHPASSQRCRGACTERVSASRGAFFFSVVIVVVSRGCVGVPFTRTPHPDLRNPGLEEEAAEHHVSQRKSAHTQKNLCQDTS